ncbi:MAG: ROK family transcriptional regulator [Bacteroidales bacterium]|nr:ROK family transcriptional regulator [Bacteroidales bacterium]
MNYFTKNGYYDETLSIVEKKKNLLGKKIVNFLYFHGPKSAVEISKKLKSSIPTVTAVLLELCDSGIVIEQGQGSSSGGRRPNLFGLKNDSLFILGIDIGRYATKMAIFDSNFKNVTGLKTINVKLVNKPETLDLIFEAAQKLISDSGINKDKLIGVGVDMPGLIDAKAGRNYTYLHQEESTLSKVLSQMFSLPVFIENDAKARALAEYRFGLAKGRKNVLSLHVGWGLGLGIIINGKLYRGNSGFTGEFSHLPIIENGVLCECGKRGCLETVASGKGLVHLAQKQIESQQDSPLAKLIASQEKELVPKSIIEAANHGDQFAISIISQVGLELGKGIAILIQLLNPELIILGGRVAEANQYLLTPIQQSLNHYCMPRLRDQAELVISELGPNANILGAVATAIENIFER